MDPRRVFVFREVIQHDVQWRFEQHVVTADELEPSLGPFHGRKHARVGVLGSQPEVAIAFDELQCRDIASG
jgi:hypothetical protein